MKSSATGYEIIPPAALVQLDSQFGSQTQQAYVEAVNQAPQLEGLWVVLDDSEVSHFHGANTGLAGSWVSLNPDPAFYTEQLSDFNRPRTARFLEFFESRRIELSEKTMLEAVLLHEAGHAKELVGALQGPAEDRDTAFQIYLAADGQERAKLPLGCSTTRAINAWETNLNGFRDAFYAKGKDDSDWAKLLQKNIAAYPEIAPEKTADKFALGILATLHA